MKRSRQTFACLAFLLLLAGCGAFSREQTDTLEPREGYTTAPLDTRPLVAEVSALSIERAPGGIIVHARAVASSIGYWDPALVRLGDREATPGETLEFAFRARPPLSPQTTGTVAARTLEAAVFVSDTTLQPVQRISVLGAAGSRIARR